MLQDIESKQKKLITFYLRSGDGFFRRGEYHYHFNTFTTRHDQQKTAL
jgi:hypothetical protein